MKILRIGLNNLNSLRGEHAVDLETEPLGTAGIFAITGQTGAGKSTLLDAVTLALYGRAARYGESPNPEDMMSRHSGECSAEVDFEVPKGRFRGVWQLRRARGKADGKLQPPKRYLYDADGVVLAEKIGDVTRMVEDLCGLDYNRFTRSVLLAQGEFAKFLKAKPDERAELLESLTRTGVYSSLGMLLHEEYARRESELKEAERRLGEIVLLDAGDRETKEQELRSLEEKWAELRRKRAQLGEELARARQLGAHLEKQRLLLTEQETLAREKEKSAVPLKKLEQHRLAQPFLPDLAQLDQSLNRSKAQTQQAEQSQIASEVARTAWITTLHEVSGFAGRLDREAANALARATAECGRCEKRRNEAQAWIQSHATDANLAGALPDLKVHLTKLEQARQRLAELKPEAAGDPFPETLAEARETLETLLAAGDERARQSRLDQLRERRGTLVRLLTQAKTRDQLQTRNRQIRDRMADLEKQLPDLRDTLATQQENRETLEALLKSQRDHLQAAQKIASLEEHRANLKPGEECPLCGALEHPFADGESRLPGLIEIEEQLSETTRKSNVANSKLQTTQLSAIKTEAALAELRSSRADVETELSGVVASLEKEASGLGLAQHDRGFLTDAFIAAEKNIETETASLAALQNARRAVTWMQAQAMEAESVARLALLLGPFAVPRPGAGRETETWKILETRQHEWGRRQEALRQAIDDLKQAQANEKEARGTLRSLQQQTGPLRQRCAEIPLPPGANIETRNWPDLDAAQRSLLQTGNDAEAKAASCQERQNDAEALHAETLTQEAELTAKLAGSPFENLAALRHARLTPDEELGIATLKSRLDESRDRLKGNLETLNEEISKLRSVQTPEDEAFEKLAADFENVGARFDQLSESRANLRGLLQRDRENRELSAARAASLAGERAKLETWSRLHELIGDSKGKKFRLYAQGISLDLLIRHANQHLRGLAERYQLTRSVGEELELQIEDRFQAGAIRPMASLSGGESFLASLALALGLSDLAGRNVQIDSLFIDEGFGSLDSDSLEIAISALEGLRQKNKTVCIISHVEILKERVSTQINVEKQPNGTSQLVLR